MKDQLKSVILQMYEAGMQCADACGNFKKFSSLLC